MSNLLSTLLGRGKSAPEPEPEPEPEVAEETVTKELDVHEVTATFQNGDTETFEAYNVYSRGSDSVTFNVETDLQWSLSSGDPYISYNRRTLSFHVMTREPVLEQIGTETWELRYETFDGKPQRDSAELEKIDRSVDTRGARDEQ
ncbi:hypothetical protein HTZ84_22435 [Haloterrigena sp. SYSU A558-1]|uniref:Lipocalin-like domain-containing protein n=1 Tax=Haloterrigena gelatinilytica TaxID=2741724 RepID=A0ABX2LH35_9EURY|nr:hypothetical protein [Haloterrigena gelatinilytica]NUC75026.1 hypothetical protein [Haloterrigena gelatinilytica]